MPLYDTNKVAIIRYHFVHDENTTAYPNIRTISTNMFKMQLDFMQEHFRIITMDHLINAATTGRTLPPNAALLTFDDGYIDHYTNVFPLLSDRKIQASFFLPTHCIQDNTLLDVNKLHFILAVAKIDILVDSVFKKLDYYRGLEYNIEENDVLYNKFAVPNRFDNASTAFVKRLLLSELNESLSSMILSDLFREFVGIDENSFSRRLYLTYQQVKVMKKNGMNFGLRYDIPSNSSVADLDRVSRDIDSSLDYWKDIINIDSWAISHPYSEYNEDSFKLLEQKGCKLGLTMRLKIADINGDNRYELGRVYAEDMPPNSNQLAEYLK